MEGKSQRSFMIDALKGVAIIAVALYHFGGNWLPYGYLGVDVFFVVSGYLLTKQISKQIDNNQFSYLKFIFRKLIRLWLPILVAEAVSMIIGFFLMLPDDYENLAESVIASSAFANNILCCITTKNYWDIVNFYKPLMHLWYVGLLMQAYIFLSFIFLLFSKMFKNSKKGLILSAAVITVLSLGSYLMPSFSNAWKFYYLPFRLFEITSGGIVALMHLKICKRVKQVGTIGTIVVLIVIICARVVIVSPSTMLIITVVSTALCLICCAELEINSKTIKTLTALTAAIGKRSYSIYIWHQIVIAFLFYSVFSRQGIISFIVFTLSTIVLSFLSYMCLEQPLGKISRESNRKGISLLALCVVLTVAICGSAYLVYKHAGVVRDVPELNIFKNNVHKNMHAEYCDIPYSWDRDFEEDGKIKVLVIGDSFGRDWANILNEWDTESLLDISYIYPDSRLEGKKGRIADADFVFCSREAGISIVMECATNANIYVIGNKNYGKSNGIIYAHRGSPGYFSQTAEINQTVLTENQGYAKKYCDYFIDLMLPVQTDENRVRVFTDDNKFISQDCRHLTKAGAQYYSRILDISSLLKLSKK